MLKHRSNGHAERSRYWTPKSNPVELFLKSERDTDAGINLEKLISAHYEALDYKVTHDINIGGHQVDLLATRYVPGFGLTTLMIEAKHRSGRSISIDEVTKFKNTAIDLRNAGFITGAVLVTDSVFSQDAKSAASAARGITLLTVRDLEQDLFNFSESLLKTIADYEDQPIFRDYVPLAALQASRRHPDIVSYLRQWSSGSARYICVLGDFGSGKTTVLDRLFYEQAKARLADPAQPYPILLRLSKFLAYPDIWAFALDGLRESQYVSPPRRILERKLKQGNALLILDGFDEIQTSATAQDRQRYFETLAPLIAAGSRCVISTRPTYFENPHEMARMLDKAIGGKFRPERMTTDEPALQGVLGRLGIAAGPLRTRKTFSDHLHMEQLSYSGILSYLEKWRSEIMDTTGSTPEEVRAFLFKIYDLKSLMERPLLLKMIVMTLLEGGLNLTDPKVKWGPAFLYDLYTQICAQRDLKGRSEGLSAADRLAVCRQMAVQMLEERRLELSSDDVAAAVRRVRAKELKKVPAHNQPTTLERWTTDVQVCSFLSFSSDGRLRFAHRSYYEFFLAQWVVVECEKDYTFFTRLLTEAFTSEVLYFLASYARDHDPFTKAVRVGLRGDRNPSPAAQGLFRRIAVATGIMLSGARFSDGLIRDVFVPRSEITDASLERISIEKVRIRDVTASSLRLDGCTLSACDIAGLTLSDSVFSAIVDDSKLSKVLVDGGRFAINGGTWTLADAHIRHAEVHLQGAGSVFGLRIEACRELSLGAKLTLRAGSSLRVDAEVVQSENLGRWYEIGVDILIERALLAGLFVDARDLLVAVGMNETQDPNKLLLKNCRGLVLTRDLGSVLTREQLSALKNSVPNIVVFDLAALECSTDTPTGSNARRHVPRRSAAIQAANAELRQILERLGLETLASKALSSVLQATANDLPDSRPAIPNA